MVHEVSPSRSASSTAQASCTDAAIRSAFEHAHATVHVPALCDEAVDREWSGASQDKSRETSEVQEDGFIARLSELRAGRSYGDELDGTKAIWQVHRKHRHEENHSHRYADSPDKRTQ